MKFNVGDLVRYADDYNNQLYGDCIVVGNYMSTYEYLIKPIKHNFELYGTEETNSAAHIIKAETPLWEL